MVTRQLGARRMPIDGGMRVTHSELFVNITSSVNPLIIQQVIQPGLASLSTWLEAQAQDYDQYRLVGFVVEYIPVCGTGTQGNVLIAYDYDPTDTPPLTEQGMSNYLGAVESSAWSGFRTSIDAKAVHAPGPRKYLRNGPVSGDERVYDSGQFLVLTTGGIDNATPWGKLWIHYTFDLLLQTAPVLQSLTKWYAWENLIPQVIPAGTGAAIVFDNVLSNWTSALQNGPPFTAVFVPPGAYVVTIIMEVYNTPAILASNNVLLRLTQGGAVVQQVAASWPVIGAGMSQVMTLVFGVANIAPPGVNIGAFVQNNLGVAMTVGVNSQISFAPA